MVREVIAELQQSGWQSEARYVESFIRSRAERGHGPVKIRTELRAKGVDAALIEAILGEMAIDWSEIAKRAYRRKYGETPIGDYNDYGRRWRFLAQRGFESDQIRSLLDER